MNEPPKPTGNSSAARWFAWAHEAIVALTRMQVRGGKLERTGTGYRLVINPGGPASAKSDPAPPVFVQAIVSEERDNYLVAVRGSETIKVAKPFKLRRSSYDGQTEEILGITHSYTYVDKNARTDRVSSKNWDQRIYPPYKVGDRIYATIPDGGTGVKDDSNEEVEYLDMNVDSRTWTTVFGICDDGEVKEMLAGGTAPGRK